jgi:hypothetical protein
VPPLRSARAEHAGGGGPTAVRPLVARPPRATAQPQAARDAEPAKPEQRQHAEPPPPAQPPVPAQLPPPAQAPAPVHQVPQQAGEKASVRGAAAAVPPLALGGVGKEEELPSESSWVASPREPPLQELPSTSLLIGSRGQQRVAAPQPPLAKQRASPQERVANGGVPRLPTANLATAAAQAGERSRVTSSPAPAVPTPRRRVASLEPPEAAVCLRDDAYGGLQGLSGHGHGATCRAQPWFAQEASPPCTVHACRSHRLSLPPNPSPPAGKQLLAAAPQLATATGAALLDALRQVGPHSRSLACQCRLMAAKAGCQPAFEPIPPMAPLLPPRLSSLAQVGA